MNQDWFEMQQVRGRRFNSAVWIPLRASQRTASAQGHGEVGYNEELFRASSIAVNLDKKASAETLDWSSVDLSHSHVGYVEGDRYVPADVFNGYCGAESGMVPVSAVSPALLVSEIEIQKKNSSQDRPPFLPKPEGKTD